MENKQNIGLALGLIVLILGPIFIIPQIVQFMIKNEVSILEGNYLLTTDLVVEKKQQLITRNGKITFKTNNISIIVYGWLTGINTTIEGKIIAYDHALVQITNSSHTIDEIYAYNSAQVQINNSTVRKIYAYNSSKVIIDGVVYEAWMFNSTIDTSVSDHTYLGTNLTFAWKFSPCDASNKNIKTVVGFSIGFNTLFFTYIFSSYCGIKPSDYNFSYSQLGYNIQMTGKSSSQIRCMCDCQCQYNVTGYLKGLASGTYKIEIFKVDIFGNQSESSLEYRGNVWI